MNTKNTRQDAEKKTTETREAAPRYEAPRITRKQSLERVTLASAGGVLG